MTRWAIVDSSSNEVQNFIEAETFDIANSATLFNQIPVECPSSLVNIRVGFIYNSESLEFLEPGDSNA